MRRAGHRVHRDDARHRVEACLAQHGLFERSSWFEQQGWFGGAAPTPSSDANPTDSQAADGLWAQRLIDAASDLGPTFQLFTDYLGSRPDVLPIDDVLQLRAARVPVSEPPPLLPPTPIPPTNSDPVQRAARELQRPAAELFADFDPEPVRRGRSSDDYRARLHPGVVLADATATDATAVEVWLRLRRPGLAAAAQHELPQLQYLQPAFARRLDPTDADRTNGWSVFQATNPARDTFQRLLRDFEARLEQDLDLRTEGASLRQLAAELADADLLAVPRVLFATPRLLILGALPVAHFDLRPPSSDGDEPAASSSQAGSSRAGSSRASSPRARDLARRLHLAWLQQALVTGHAPLDAAWAELRDGRLALLAGRCCHLGTAALPRLCAYLQQLADHLPEEAYDAIAGELTAVGSTRGKAQIDERRVRQRLRQLVPFRDGGWSEKRDTLAELLVLHWRLLRELGLQPSPALASLYTGLFESAADSRHLDPTGDPLRRALDDLHWLTGVRRLRQFAGPAVFGQALEANLSGLLEMPQKLDRLLHLLSGEADHPLRLDLRVADRGEQRSDTFTTVLCLGLLMAAVALLAPRLPDLGVDPAWAEPGTAVLFLVLGAWLLRAITRP